MMALRAGARHATLAQRWLYLSLSAHEAAAANGFTDDQVSVPAASRAGRQQHPAPEQFPNVAPDAKLIDASIGQH